jgi:hypothetical protein
MPEISRIDRALKELDQAVGLLEGVVTSGPLLRRLSDALQHVDQATTVLTACNAPRPLHSVHRPHRPPGREPEIV